MHYKIYLTIIEGYSDANQLKLSPQVDIFLLLAEERYLENYPNKHVSLTLQWSLTEFIALDEAGKEVE